MSIVAIDRLGASERERSVLCARINKLYVW
jgi:hypothetical protein